MEIWSIVISGKTVLALVLSLVHDPRAVGANLKVLRLSGLRQNSSGE